MEWRHHLAKPHRLPPEAYFGDRAVVVTACVENRLRPFQTPEITRECIELLKAATAKEECICSLYVFMPDNLHLIIRGKEPDSSIMNCLKRFKQSSGFLLSKNGYRWQKASMIEPFKVHKKCVSKFAMWLRIQFGLVWWRIRWIGRSQVL